MQTFVNIQSIIFALTPSFPIFISRLMDMKNYGGQWKSSGIVTLILMSKISIVNSTMVKIYFMLSNGLEMIVGGFQ
jgi:hypothetical protein